MQIIIEAPFQLDEQQRKNLETQIEDLKKFNIKFTQAGIFFKKDDGTLTDSIVADIQLHVPGPVIFASATHNDLLGAFAGALEKAEAQLRKIKDVKTDHHKGFKQVVNLNNK